MGINGAMKRILKKSSCTIDLHDLSTHPNCNKNNPEFMINNPLILIDALSMIHRLGIGGINSGKYVTNKNGEKITDLYSLYIIAHRFISIGIDNGLTPVFVFDGRAPTLKTETLNKRNRDKEKAEEKVQEMKNRLGAENIKCDQKNGMDDEIENNCYQKNETNNNDINAYIKQLKRSYRPDSAVVQKAMKLLRAMGVCVIKAPGEADAQLAALAHYNARNVVGIVTDDVDPLICGATGILKMPSLGSNKMEYYTLSDTLENLSISMQRVIDKSNDPDIKYKYANKKISLSHKHIINICCALGTDYCTSGIDVGGCLKNYQIDERNSDTNFHLKNNNKRNNKDKFDAVLEFYAKHDMSLKKVTDALKGTLSANYIKRILDSRIPYTSIGVLDPKHINLEMRKPRVRLVYKMLIEFISKTDAMNAVNMLETFYDNQLRRRNNGDNRNSVSNHNVNSNTKKHYGNYNNRGNYCDITNNDQFKSFSSYKAKYTRNMMKNTQSKSHGSHGSHGSRGSHKSRNSYEFDESYRSITTRSWPEPLYKRSITLTC